MSSSPWNHNIHYHGWVLSCVPPDCRRALDLGCGTGLLVKRLAGRCNEVIGIERDHDTWERASSDACDNSHVQILEGDFMSYSFEENSFDLITAVAVLHHLPLVPALTRVRSLLAPGGVLAVIGLYRPESILDFASAIAAIPIDWSMKMRRGYYKVDAPILASRQTLCDIKAACDQQLPGTEIKRRLLYRYSLFWRKP